MINRQLQIRGCGIGGAATRSKCVYLTGGTRRVVRRMAMDNVRLTEALPVRCHTVKTFFRH